MSHYLVDRISHRSNIEVVTETEVAAVHGNGRLETVDLRDRRDGRIERVGVAALFIMIGADPCTEAVHGVLGVDPAGYLVCGTGAAGHAGPIRWPLGGEREPLLLETVRPGVFAAGDVRAGASKRVASAVGDGALAVRLAFQVLQS
jgi:thioredoxin reductase (NADPH)